MAQNTDPNEIEVFRGDDFGTQLVFKDSDDVAIDITGWTVFFTVKKRREDTDAAALISVTVPPTDPTHGIALITVSHTLTDTLTGTFFYDFKYKKLDGTVQTITSGGITFLQNITRRIG